MHDLKIFTDNIEPEALNQVYELAKLPVFSESKIRIMPDCHSGKGCVIGFTSDISDKVVPNLVGVDIGCGVLVVNLEQHQISLEYLDEVIRRYVPSGRSVHKARNVRFEKLKELHCYRELKDTKYIERSIGTLGGGNHFIEVDIDNENNKYLIIHSGSRNLGKQVAEYYQNIAIELMQGKDELYKKQEKLISEYKVAGRKKEIEKAIKELHRTSQPEKIGVPKELCYLEGEWKGKYLHDMYICQEYASLNRYHIANLILSDLFGVDMAYYGLEMFETVHNYIEKDTNIIRKGAISAKKDELLLIPINMRDGCILGKGKGNPDWNYSAPHGAGRLMSRTKAKELLNIKDFETSMDGIYTTSVSYSTLDESPMAYKPMEDIVDRIGDTVEIIKILKPVYNFKASE